MTHTSPATLLRAAAARDAAGLDVQPAALLIRDGRIASVGSPNDVPQPPGDVQIIDLPDTLLLPAMVNAHAHFDLSTLGPQPFDGDFSRWLADVMRDRPATDEAVREAVRQGLTISREAGVGWVGDIAGSDAAARTFAREAESLGIGGTTWLECFGIGQRSAAAARDALQRRAAIASDATAGVRVDLQPHAPYSSGLPLYEAVGQRPDARPSTHLAESLSEDDFVRHATGPFADLLRQIGKWDDNIAAHHASPVQYLAAVLSLAPWVVAHCNYVGDDDIAILAAAGASVAYCPLASEYFQHAGHRYRDMLAAGVNVCLGTDSILCQSADAAQPLGLLTAMRRLHARDGVAADTLLAMATTHGARAMGLPSNAATLSPGAPACVVGITIDPQSSQDSLTQAMRSDYPVRVIAWR